MNSTKVFKKNIEENKLEKISLYPYAISESKKFVDIEKNKTYSTGNIVLKNNGKINTRSFKQFIQDYNIDISNIGIIKIDTDGYDWDCLNSIYEGMKDLNLAMIPQFIFYEHLTTLNNLGKFDSDRQKKEKIYIESLKKLRLLNYKKYFIFDNFGTFILKTANLNKLKQIISYSRKSELVNNHRPFYYCDVLIAKKGNDKLIDKVLKSMEQKCIIVA